MLNTEYQFELPCGYLDSDGNLHRHGMMRMATALDEIAPMRDPRVQSNPGYLAVIVLSRVITRLGSVSVINPKTIENLFAADLVYLQDLYRRVNEQGHTRLSVTCPHCDSGFDVEVQPSGE